MYLARNFNFLAAFFVLEYQLNRRNEVKRTLGSDLIIIYLL